MFDKFDNETSNSYEETNDTVESRYMNEGSRAAAPARRGARFSVSNSVPYGSENGGLLDWFRDKFSGDDNEEEDPFEDNDEDELSEFSEDGSYDFESAHKILVRTSTDILSSFKGEGKTDSAEMTEVKRSLRQLLASLSKNVPRLYQTFMVSLTRINSEYEDAIAACDAYISHIKSGRKGILSLGKERLSMVESIRSLITREYKAFAPTAKAHFKDLEEADDMEWEDFISKVETDSVDLTKTKTAGSQASLLLVRDSEQSGKEFIKIEETMAADDSKSSIVDSFLSYKGGASMFGPLIHGIQGYYEIHKDGKSPEFNVFFRNLCMGSSGGIYSDVLENYINKDETLKKMWTQFSSYKNKIAAGNSEAHTAFNERGTAISDRNEATSRLADKLGIGDLIARSETRVFDQGNGSIARANVMQGAKGMSMEKFKVAAKNAEKEGKKVHIQYSPQSVMQLFSLEIFDWICAQIDRHDGNYFVRYEVQPRPGKKGETPEEDWVITSVQGIDNDAAFGVLSFEDMQAGSAYNKYHSVPLFDAAVKGDIKRGVLTITFLPESFYKRLLEYTPYEATADLVDTRSRAELKSLEERMGQVVDAVREQVELGNITIIKDGDTEAMNAAFESLRDRASHKETTPMSELWNKPIEEGVQWKFLKREEEK
ncbi:MAG: hypothetical protein IK115_08065 [Lachnospiraceae bacterium]|nr:hypothetical protein [Lachnospiraceae bacterium]